jgi:DNA invertase Pin-like site-specific DNA recombinase
MKTWSSGSLDARPGLIASLKALRAGDRLLVWKLDRLGRNVRHLVNTVHELTAKGVGFRVLTGHGASINTTTPEGNLVFGIFAALAEFERELVSERTKVGLAAARASGRRGGGQYKMTAAKLRLAMAAMGQRQTVVSELCKQLGGHLPDALPSSRAGWLPMYGRAEGAGAIKSHVRSIA